MNSLQDIMDRMLKEIRRENRNVFDLALYRDGEWAAGVVRPTAPCQNAYSVTKSFTCTAVGLAADAGLLTADAPLAGFFRDELPAGMDERMERATLRHLMSNTLGLEDGYLFEADRYTHGTDDWLTLCLGRPLAYEPGTRYTYSNSNFYLLSRVVHKATGMTMDAWLRERLFDAMDIRDCAWAVCPAGYPQGGTGLYVSTADMAKLGALYVQEGLWDGRRLLSATWCREAVRDQAGVDQTAYGYGIWVHPDRFEFSGAYDQVVQAYPGERLVLAAHAFENGYDYAGLLTGAMAGE